VLLLKEIPNLTDMEALEQLEFDLLWQHALGLSGEQAHLCQKTLHNFRARLLTQDPARLVFAETTDRMVAALPEYGLLGRLLADASRPGGDVQPGVGTARPGSNGTRVKCRGTLNLLIP
jgi:hypothetical protein